MPHGSTDELRRAGSAPSDAGPVTAPRRRRRVVAGALAVVVCGSVAAGVAVWQSQGDPPYFPSGSAFWEPVVADPVLDPDGAEIAEVLASSPTPASLNTGAFGQPVYVADEQTPRHRVRVLNEGTTGDGWGTNVLSGTLVPIPDGAEPSTGSDGKLVVIDPDAELVYDLWRAEQVDGEWTTEWGGIYPLDGDGSSHRAAYGEGEHKVTWPQPVSRGTGSGISSLAGLIRVEELVEGHIPHALVFITDAACGPPQAGPYRWPATTTDGFVMDGPCIPQGTRIQLDPDVDLASLDLSPVELTVARALQEYGAYPVDIGGARLNIIAEAPRTPEDVAVMAELGLTDDYHHMDGLPLDRFRVLRNWDGA